MQKNTPPKGLLTSLQAASEGHDAERQKSNPIQKMNANLPNTDAHDA
jgi:hypothetical protein